MKHLRSCTIVPKQYYVERDADRQIRSIIEDMGRPGYVLVARQMGKSNLLLHTKECFENDKNIYVYIDFTTINEVNERGCFQNIINTALLTNADLFSEESRIIRENRKDDTISPQQQYTSELLILLKKVDKIVIILDEIDALTNCSYSDQIFSQVRGHYFQRANFRDLEKLTYVLSGVIEPKEIIKDPKISPFNIGEKIYLKDFTKGEFNKFVSNIELDQRLPADLIDYIYYWTHGHPRLTWDICQEIEGNEDVLSREAINDIVKKIYLTSYDHAPVDGIREQVSKDMDLARAVIELHINKGQSISEEIRNQLYLAGIIDYSDNSVQFKNPIIEKSLPYDWLFSFQTREDVYLQEAIREIKLDRDYKGAIPKLQMLLSSQNLAKKGRVHYYLGHAYMGQYKYEDALVHFSKIKENESDYFEGLYWMGYCHSIFHRWDEAKKAYDLINDKCKDRELRQKTIVALAESLFKTGDVDNIKYANNLLVTLLNALNKEDVNIHLTVLIYFDLAMVSNLMGEEHGALSSIDYAINFAQDNERPILLHYKLQLLKDKQESDAVAEELINSLDIVKTKPPVDNIDNKLVVNQYSLALIFAEIILNYPHLEPAIEPKMKILYEKREDAFFTILIMLADTHRSEYYQDDDASIVFASVMIERFKKGWGFSAGQILRAYAIKLRNEKYDEISINESHEIYEILSKNTNLSEVDATLSLPIVKVFNEQAHTGSGVELERTLKIYKRFFEESSKVMVSQLNICTFYFYSCFFYRTNQVGLFFKYSIEFMRRINNFMTLHGNDDNIVFKAKTISDYIGELKNYGQRLRDISGINSVFEMRYGKIHNSRRVRVLNKVTNIEETNKYKKFRDDIFSGFCDFIGFIEE